MINEIPKDIAIGDVFLKRGGTYTHAVYIGEWNEVNLQSYLDLKMNTNRLVTLNRLSDNRHVFILFGNPERPGRFILDSVTERLESFKLESKLENFKYSEDLKRVEEIVNQFKATQVKKQPDFMVPGNIYSENGSDWKWICVENWVEVSLKKARGRESFGLLNIDVGDNEEINAAYPYTCICWNPGITQNREIFIGFFSKDGTMNPILNNPIKSLKQEAGTTISDVPTRVLRVIYKNNLLPDIFKKPEIVPGNTFEYDGWNYTVIEDFSKKEFNDFGLKLNHGQVGKNKDFPFTVAVWSYVMSGIVVDNCDENGFLCDGAGQLRKLIPSPSLPGAVSMALKAVKVFKEKDASKPMKPEITIRPEKAFYSIIMPVGGSNNLQVVIRCLDKNLICCQWDKENIPVSTLGSRYTEDCKIQPIDITFDEYLKVNGWKNKTVDDEIADLRKEVLEKFGCQKVRFVPHYDAFLKILESMQETKRGLYTVEAVEFMYEILAAFRSELLAIHGISNLVHHKTRIKDVVKATEKMLQLISQKDSKDEK